MTGPQATSAGGNAHPYAAEIAAIEYEVSTRLCVLALTVENKYKRDRHALVYSCSHCQKKIFARQQCTCAYSVTELNVFGYQAVAPLRVLAYCHLLTFVHLCALPSSKVPAFPHSPMASQGLTAPPTHTSSHEDEYVCECSMNVCALSFRNLFVLHQASNFPQFSSVDACAGGLHFSGLSLSCRSSTVLMCSVCVVLDRDGTAF